MIKFCNVQVEKKRSDIANRCLDKTTQHLSSGKTSLKISSFTKIHEKELVSKEPAEFDQVKYAEALHVLRVAESDYSLTSSENIGKLFMQMFPGNISSQF